MAKISINCRLCEKSKGCSIKKSFKDLAKSIEEENKYEGFKLKCSEKTYKWKTKDRIFAKIGIGRHMTKTEVECNRTTADAYGDEEYDCKGCSLSDNCEDTIITYEHLKYSEYIEVEGIVSNHYKGDLFAIAIKMPKHENLTKLDIKYFESKFDEHMSSYLSIENSLFMNDRTSEGFDFLTFVKNKNLRLRGNLK